MNQEEPGPTLIEVPDDKGNVNAKSFRSAAWSRCAGRCSASASRPPASRYHRRRRRGEQYSRGGDQRFPQGRARVKVAVRNQKGKAVLDFKGIPEDQLELLGRGRPSTEAAFRAAGALTPRC